MGNYPNLWLPKSAEDALDRLLKWSENYGGYREDWQFKTLIDMMRDMAIYAKQHLHDKEGE